MAESLDCRVILQLKDSSQRKWKIWLANEKIFLYNKDARRRSHVVRQESAKLPFSGPNPLVASNCFLQTVEIQAAKAVK